MQPRWLLLVYCNCLSGLLFWVGIQGSVEDNLVVSSDLETDQKKDVPTLKDLFDDFQSAANLTMDVSSSVSSMLKENPLAYLLRLGNQTNYAKNLTQLAKVFNRTSRDYGGWGGGGYGGGWGGGIDPSLLLLLKDDDHGWGPYPQQSSGMDMGALAQDALTALLGLALISRFPTQG